MSAATQYQVPSREIDAEGPAARSHGNNIVIFVSRRVSRRDEPVLFVPRTVFDAVSTYAAKKCVIITWRWLDVRLTLRACCR